MEKAALCGHAVIEEDEPQSKLKLDSLSSSRPTRLFELLTTPVPSQRTFDTHTRTYPVCSTSDSTATEDLNGGVGPSEVLSSLNRNSGMPTGDSVLTGIIRKELKNEKTQIKKESVMDEINCGDNNVVEDSKGAVIDGGELRLQLAAPNLMAYLTSQITIPAVSPLSTMRSLLTGKTITPPSLSSGLLIVADQLNEKVSQPSPMLRELLLSSSVFDVTTTQSIPVKKRARGFRKRCRNDTLPSSSPTLRKLPQRSTRSLRNLAENDDKSDSSQEDSFLATENRSMVGSFLPVVPTNLIKVGVAPELDEELSVDEILPDLTSSSSTPPKECDGCILMESIVKIETEEPSSSYDKTGKSALSASVHFTPFEERSKTAIFVDSIMGTIVKFEQNENYDNDMSCESQHSFD